MSNAPVAAAAPLRGTIHSIQMMRAIAAMLVVWFHAQHAFATSVSRPLIAAESYLFSFGAVGVHIFFVISGFIMVYTTREESYSIGAFYRRRLIRIYPIYWICAALTLAGFALAGTPWDRGPTKLVAALFLLPGSAAAIIPPGWTLAFELLFYLCFGVAMLAGLTRGLIALTALFLATIALGVAMPVDNAFIEMLGSPLLLEFVAGAGVAWLLVKGRLPRRGGLSLVALSIGLFAIGIAAGFDRVPRVISWGVPSWLLITGLVMAEQNGLPQWVRKIGFFGDSSYALYLIHWIVVVLAVKAVLSVDGFHPEPAVAAVVLGFVTLGVAEWLHRRVERVMLRWLNPQRALVPPRAP